MNLEKTKKLKRKEWFPKKIPLNSLSFFVIKTPLRVHTSKSVKNE